MLCELDRVVREFGPVRGTAGQIQRGPEWAGAGWEYQNRQPSLTGHVEVAELLERGHAVHC